MTRGRVGGRDWGAAVIFLATGILVAAVAFGSCVAKINAGFHRRDAENAEKKSVGGCGVAHVTRALADRENRSAVCLVGEAGKTTEPCQRKLPSEQGLGANRPAEWYSRGRTGQPPIIWTVTPAGSKVAVNGETPQPPPTDEPKDKTVFGPGGQRFEGKGSGRPAGNAGAPVGGDIAEYNDRPAGKSPAGRYPPSVRRALDLLRLHESVDGTQMVGDNGLARGWLQQHRDHWQVGCERLGVQWPWPADTHDLAKCEAVCVANWERYCPDALECGDVELLVRSHRLPCAPWRADNDAYWRKVRGQ